jgi:hypothetical protein
VARDMNVQLRELFKKLYMQESESFLNLTDYLRRHHGHFAFEWPGHGWGMLVVSDVGGWRFTNRFNSNL